MRRRSLPFIAVLILALSSFLWIRSRDRLAVLDAPTERHARTRTGGGGRTPMPPVVRAPRVTAAPTNRPNRIDAPANTVAAGDTVIDLRATLEGLQCSPAVSVIMGLDPAHDGLNARRAALKTLTRDLSDDDILALRMFLKVPFQADAGLRDRDFFAIKNDVLDVLVRQDALPDGLGAELVGMCRDEKQDPVWRIYSAQYLAPYYVRRWPAGDVMTPSSEREQIEALFEALIIDETSDMAGTALIGLRELSSGSYETFSRQRLEQAAVQLATAENSSEGTRITALRMCGLLKKREALPIARMLVQTGETTVLRLAAIATVGDIGDADDVNLLLAMKECPERRISELAGKMAKRLQERMRKRGGRGV